MSFEGGDAAADAAANTATTSSRFAVSFSDPIEAVLFLTLDAGDPTKTALISAESAVSLRDFLLEALRVLRAGESIVRTDFFFGGLWISASPGERLVDSVRAGEETRAAWLVFVALRVFRAGESVIMERVS